MAISEHFKQMNYINAVFDPVPSYNGSWYFALDNLIENANASEKQNLFLEFLNKTYNEPMLNIFKNKRILEELPYMVSLPNENKIGRCLKYSKVHFYAYIITLLDLEIDKYGKDEEEFANERKELISKINSPIEDWHNILATKLKEKCEKLKDVLDKEIESIYFEAAMKDYVYYKGEKDFSTYINDEYKYINDLANGILHLHDFFEHNIDFTSLGKCFSDDVFSLLFAKIIYEYVKNMESKTNTLDNSSSYLRLYKNALVSIRSINYNYNLGITYIYPSMRRISYRVNDFLVDYEELFKRHPEVKEVNLARVNEDNSSYKDITLMEKIGKLYDDDISKNWQITSFKDILYSDLEMVKMRLEILERSGYIGSPRKGLNSFLNYYAFFYANGLVIIDNFIKEESLDNKSIDRPTLVMNIDMFLQISKSVSGNLYECLKTLDSSSFKRIYHSNIDRWQNELYKEVNSNEDSDHLSDVINFVNGLESVE